MGEFYGRYRGRILRLAAQAPIARAVLDELVERGLIAKTRGGDRRPGIA